ncbi:MAG: hypothetical protein ACTSSF_12415, partial [Candidatus Heimdallarchaeaceae archaeon]
MRKKKAFRAIEIFFLVFGILGAPIAYFSPLSIEIRDTSLSIKKGDILTLKIQEYNFGFTVTGNVSPYIITSGIFLY